MSGEEGDKLRLAGRKTAPREAREAREPREARVVCIGVWLSKHFSDRFPPEDEQL